MDVTVDLSLLWDKPCFMHPLFCSILCLSHTSYGAAFAPAGLWEAAQEAEKAEWNDSWLDGDRVAEHIQGFGGFACAPQRLGHVLEMGAGPWTQTRGILHARSNIEVESLTIFEPAADFYMRQVGTCAYQSHKLKRLDGGEFDFPLRIMGYKGEQLVGQEFDTVVSINVLEHVQNAFQFLNNLYAALKPGGTLIFHERYYEDIWRAQMLDHPDHLTMLHPIRVRHRVLDWFLADMDIVFNNCEGGERDSDREQEQGYYIIAKKRLSQPDTGADGTSHKDDEGRDREGEGKRVLSYSLFGANSKYLDGALDLANTYRSVYPNWTMVPMYSRMYICNTYISICLCVHIHSQIYLYA